MKKNNLISINAIIIVTFLFFLPGSAISQNFTNHWTKNIGGILDEVSYCVENDSLGNVYSAGYFSSPSNFGTANMLNNSGGEDLFLAKYDKDGNNIWAKNAQGALNDEVRGLKTDKDGTSYITGYFESTSLDFGNGNILYNNGGKDIFLAKYDNNGLCLWAVGAGNMGYDYGYGVTTDYQGNVYITGVFTDSVDFGNSKLIGSASDGIFDIFIAKYNSNGICQWAVSAGGIGQDHANDIQVDKSGNIFITGYFENLSYFGTNSVYTPVQCDAYIAKFDNMGVSLWVKQFGGTIDDYGKSVQVDDFGNAYVVGTYEGTIDFGNGIPLTTYGDHDIFIAKYDNNGVCLWANNAGGAGWDGAYGIELKNNFIYVTGYYHNTANFGNLNILSSKGATDIFLAEYDSSGLCNRVVGSGGSTEDFAYDISINATNEIFVTGFFENTAYFDTSSISSSGLKDIFIAKYRGGAENLIISNKIIKNATCFGISDGELSISISGGIAPYSVLWSTGSIDTTVVDLSAGIYSVTVTDSYNVSLIDTLKIYQPSMIFPTIGVQSPTCNGFSDGVINIDATGGIGPYTYQWSNDSTGNVIYGLKAGLYNVTISDSNMCQRIKSINITEPTKVSSTFTHKNPKCNGSSDGEATISATGGIPPYSYLWFNDFTGTTQTNLSSGQYSVVVSDSNNCSISNTIELSNPLMLKDTILTLKSASCDGAANGLAIVSGIGGIAPYSYLWDNGQTDNKAINLLSGSYFFTITDVNSCEHSNKLTILELGKSKLQGVARYSNGIIAESDAEVTLYNASSFPYKYISKMDIGNNGTFKFDSISNGKYVVNVKLYNHAFQKYPGVMQTYYNFTHKWQLATIIDLKCESSDTIIVEMFENPSVESGNGTIKGNVNYALNGNKSIMGEPVPGAEIAVEQEPDDMPIMQSTTREDGSYAFTNVPTGVYSLSIDIPGIPQMSTHSIILSETDLTYEGMNFIVDTGATTLGITTDSVNSVPFVLDENIQISIYPNPATEFVNIDYKLEKKVDVTIELINIDGKVLKEQKLENSFAENSIKFNVEKYESGIYFVKFESENTIYIKKISIVR